MIHVVVPILLENQNENQRQMRTIMDSNKVRQLYEYLGSLNNAGSRLQTTAPEDRPDTEKSSSILSITNISRQGYLITLSWAQVLTLKQRKARPRWKFVWSKFKMGLAVIPRNIFDNIAGSFVLLTIRQKHQISISLIYLKRR